MEWSMERLGAPVIFVAVGTVLAFYLAPKLKTKHSRPPGPPGLPIIGNLLEHPKEYEWLHWAKHKAQYGPISSVTVLGQPIILLNDLTTCNDLLEKRSSIYSNRPPLTFAGEMIGWDQQIILSPYNERFKTMRKMVHRFVGTKSSIVAFQPVQESETRLFLYRVLQNPDNLMRDIRLAQGSMFLHMSHGYTVNKSAPDPLVEVIENAAKEFYIATVPGAWLVDTLPILKHVPSWIPFVKFTQVAKKFKDTNMLQANGPHDFVKRQMKKGTAEPSFTSSYLQEDPDPVTEDAVKWASNSLYGGGTDTVVATISSFFLAMIIHPEIQRKAQQEIDTLVGSHRLPSFADRDKLIYIEALMKEVMRWNVIGPMGIPHYTTAKDIYKDMLIPKGSIVFSNIWTIAHDPDNHANPMQFNPDRFLGPNPEIDPHNYVFGFGRRGCPGQELADANVFLTVAMSLAVFDIFPPKDPVTGEEQVPKPEFISGTVSHPKPFKCRLVPRSAEALALINSGSQELEKPSDLYD